MLHMPPNASSHITFAQADHVSSAVLKDFLFWCAGAGFDGRRGILGPAAEAGARTAYGRHLPDGCSAHLPAPALLPGYPDRSPGLLSPIASA